MTARGKQYDWGLGEFAFALYCTAANIGLLLANNFVLAILGDAYSNQVKPTFQKHDISLAGNLAQAATWLYGWLVHRWTTRLMQLRPALLRAPAAVAAAAAADAAASHGPPSAKLLVSIRRSTFGASQKRQIRYAARAAVAEQRASAAATSTSSSSSESVAASQRRCAALLKSTVDEEERAEYLRGMTVDPCLRWAALHVELLAEPVDGVCHTYGVWRRLDEEAHAKLLRRTLRLAPVLRAARSLVARRLSTHRQLHCATVRVSALLERLVAAAEAHARARSARRRYRGRAGLIKVPEVQDDEPDSAAAL